MSRRWPIRKTRWAFWFEGIPDPGGNSLGILRERERQSRPPVREKAVGPLGSELGWLVAPAGGREPVEEIDPLTVVLGEELSLSTWQSTERAAVRCPMI